jgi:hypothetical protein
MAKVIEFYVPERFQKVFACGDQPQPGRVIEFCSGVKPQASTPPSGGAIARRIPGTVSNPAAGGE